MKIFIHYIFEEEDEEMASAVKTLIDNNYDENDIYAIPVESHED